MSAPRLDQIKVADIIEGDRLRDVTPEATQKLSLSLSESEKLIQPITVRPSVKHDGKYDLVIGGHRVAAAKLLGWPLIDAIIENLTDDEAALREVDENLYRTDLTAYDLTFFMNKPGALRGMAKTLRIARMLALGADQPLSEEHTFSARRLAAK